MFKKAQITTFIILGLLLLAGTTVYFFTRQVSEPQVVPQTIELQEFAQGKNPIKAYIESCLQEVTHNATQNISETGGTYKITKEEFRKYEKKWFRYYCDESIDSEKCINTFIQRQEIEDEIAEKVKEEIMECIDWDLFKNQGWTIAYFDYTVDVKINPKQIITKLKLPLTASKEGFIVKTEDFTSEISHALGEFYDLATYILNQEIEKGYFNKDEWMVKKGATIRIEKTKPYPDVLYTLTKYNSDEKIQDTFRFAIRGTDTISKIGSNLPSKKTHGCCYNPGDLKRCFSNVDRQTCVEKNGTYDPNKACGCPDSTLLESNPVCEGENCNSCTSTWNEETQKMSGKERKHGETWCSYDSILLSDGGTGGMSYVGSRHYKHSCIHGIEYIEEARDYREELCTENIMNNTATAVLRKNRWKDCSTCTTKECCTDNTYRDCTWSDWLYSGYPENVKHTNKKQCHPTVPPGFKFWEGNGAEVCNVATQHAECKGTSCPNNVVDDFALYCLFQGDCGNYRNTNDDLTQSGFFESDPLDSVRSYVYHKRGLNKDPRSVGSEVLHLALDTREESPLAKESIQLNVDLIPLLLSTAMQYFEYVQTLSVSDFLIPGKEPDVKVLTYGICQLWQPPLGGENCNVCGSSKKPCNEYQCKTLGQTCEFKYDDEGRALCFAQQKDNSAPTIEMHNITETYTTQNTQMTPGGIPIQGVEIIPKIIPYEKVEITLKTSEKTKCRMSYFPRMNFVSFPSIGFGEQTFETMHTIRLRLPPTISFPRHMYDILNISSVAEVLGNVDTLEDRYDTLKKKYNKQITLYNTLKSTNVLSIVDPLFNQGLTIAYALLKKYPFVLDLATTIIQAFENNAYYFFLECIDESGNTNEEEFFIHLGIDTEYKDTTPPVIVATNPVNNSKRGKEFALEVFTNEPATCAYANHNIPYENMEYIMNCENSPWSTTQVDGGSYKCSTKINTSEEQWYIRCSDNPPLQEKISVSLEFAPNVSIKGINNSPWLNITSEGKLFANAGSLNTKTIYTQIQTMDITLALNTPKYCRFDSKDVPFEYMEGKFDACKFSNSIEVGNYECQGRIATSVAPGKNASVYIICEEENQNERNVNKEGYRVTFPKSKAPRIIQAYPQDEGVQNPVTITVVLDTSINDEKITCTYTDDVLKGNHPMEQEGEFQYQATLPQLTSGDYHYIIACEDEAKNVAATILKFNVEE